MRKLNYRNLETLETTTSYAIAQDWKRKETFFTEEPAPKGQEERELDEKAAELNKGKKWNLPRKKGIFAEK